LGDVLLFLQGFLQESRQHIKGEISEEEENPLDPDHIYYPGQQAQVQIRNLAV
jgi:hypothetical protein